MLSRTIKLLFNKVGLDLSRLLPEDDGVLYDAYPEASLRDCCFYNIGAGDFSHRFWTNVDLASDWYRSAQEADFINFDLESLERLSVAANLAELVYSSHTVEHITNAAAENMFREAHRILKPGGLLRVTTPDIELEYAAYLRGDRTFFYWIDTYSAPGQFEGIYNRPMREASIQQIFLSHFASQVSDLHPANNGLQFSDAEIDGIFETMELREALDFFTGKCSLDLHRRYPGNHINWWSADKLCRLLREAGFEAVYRSGYGQSMAPRCAASATSTRPIRRSRFTSRR